MSESVTEKRPRARKTAIRQPKGKRLPWPRIGFWSLGALAALVLGFYVFRPEPQADLSEILAQQGFTANPGFAATFRPGDVIQIADATGPLARPVLFLRKEECFPDLKPIETPFALAGGSGRRSGSLDLTGSRAAKALPQLHLAGRGAKSWSLEIEAPRVATFTKADLSERFATRCVDDFGRALGAGDQASWYATIIETVVADTLTLHIDWTAGVSGEARAKLADAARKGLPTPKGAIQTTVDSSETTVLRALGPVVMGYRYRPMEPIME